MAGFVKAARRSDVPEGEVLGVEVEGVRICIVNADGELYAFRDNCSHRDFPLSNGELDAEDCTITCEWHGAIFDIRTGAAKGLPATQPIPTYPCKLEGDDVYVDVSA